MLHYGCTWQAQACIKKLVKSIHKGTWKNVLQPKQLLICFEILAATMADKIG